MITEIKGCDLPLEAIMVSFDGISAVFTFADQRRIGKVFAIIKNLARNDDWWQMAVDQFYDADRNEKIDMCKYMLDIFNSVKDCDFMTLEEAVMFSAYPA
jgi:hypothetical protein